MSFLRMLRNPAVFALAALFFSGTAQGLQAQITYLWQDLSRSTGHDLSEATAINSQGQIVGHFVKYPGGEIHGFFTDVDSNPFVDLTFSGGTYSVALGVNDSGQAVGQSNRAGGDPNSGRAFLTDQNGGALRDLGTLGTDEFSAATAVNHTGQVAGYSYASAVYHPHAFLSAANGGALHDLGTLGGTNSFAYGVNDSGQVAGNSSFDTTGQVHAFLSEPNGGALHDLGVLPNGHQSWATAVNNSGQVTGEAEIFNGAHHAFLTAPNGGAMSDLGNLGSAFDPTSEAYGINSSANVVGAAYSRERSGHAFLYVPTQGMQDLNDHINPASGFTLMSGEAINDAGEIVGSACTSRGDTTAFLLKPLGTTLPTYSTWQAQRFANNRRNLTVAGWDRDPDADGLQNGFEYYFNFDPNHGFTAAEAAALPRTSVQAENADKYLTFTYRRMIGSGGVPVTVGVSGDLASWDDTETAIEQVGTPVANPDQITETVTVRLKTPVNQSGITHTFFRLKLNLTHPCSATQWPASAGGNNHWYVVYETASLKWQEACDYAVSRGGYLATINSAAENSFIQSLLLAGDNPFIGGYKDANGWHWVTGEPFSYTNWNAGEPNNFGGQEDALQFLNSGAWNDTSSNSTNTFVFEFPN